MRIGNIPVGDGAPLVLLSGLNVIENEADTVETARTIQALAEKHRFPLVFKASFDKANRSRHDSYRGPGIDEGLRILASVKRETGLPILTDVHDPSQPKMAAQVADLIQVPAFLMRQTDLIAACAASGAAVNLKKGQFIAPHDMGHAVEKLKHFGCEEVLITDRGTCFGYNNLVTDMQGLVQMRDFAPVCFDATHAVQYPGANSGSSGGDRRFVAPLARAAVAVGIDALFIETHHNVEAAPCDGPSQISFEELDALLGQVRAIDDVVRSSPTIS
ncbi:MAG: 3-deoxy-8-phosphooctulonate synthase [Deltaproteobacteria bacterium]|jgi:2-dehydro-3-deoxyphosphooctonate aldolase (KDO 8-P synthase)|nr:3-deoxy-8-phosphooctulonate synthase [Deltaproteobacteria bacterium]MBW2498488.1 3-deoxy-8-phosphooctulonate synthase [Deltaproteobacteria bacterium]